MTPRWRRWDQGRDSAVVEPFVGWLPDLATRHDKDGMLYNQELGNFGLSNPSLVSRKPRKPPSIRMGYLASLPVELLLMIIYQLDRTSLKEWRLTCRLFWSLASGILFKTLYVIPRDESCQRFQNIVGDNKLRNYVRGLYFNTCEEDYDSDAEKGGPELLHSPEPSPNIKKEMSILNQLSYLEHVSLRFERHFHSDFHIDIWGLPPPAQDLEYRQKVLKWIFFSLIHCPDQPQSLEFRNLHGLSPEDPALLAMMAQVLQGLRTLRLDIVSQKWDPDVGYEVFEPHAIAQLPSTWLNPTMSTLEHLTLYSDECFGLYPKLDLTSVHFPELKSLVLGNHTFCHDDQLNWIISHAPTLRRLYLDNCSILHAVMCDYRDTLTFYHPSVVRENWTRSEGSFTYYLYSSRWHDYFARFGTELPLLQQFRIGESTWDDTSSNKYSLRKEDSIKIGLLGDRYMLFESNDGCVTENSDFEDFEIGEVPSCHEQDKDALLALFRNIRQHVGEQELIRTNCD